MLLKKFLLEREWSCLERLFRWSIAFIKELFFSFLINLFENSKLENKFCVFQRYSSKIIILFFLSWSLCPDITGSPPSLWQHLHRHILIYMHRLNLPPIIKFKYTDSPKKWHKPEGGKYFWEFEKKHTVCKNWMISYVENSKDIRTSNKRKIYWMKDEIKASDF